MIFFNTAIATQTLYFFSQEFGCNEVNNCDANAECMFDYEERRYVCECKEGFSGDGVTCTDTGESMYQSYKRLNGLNQCLMFHF